MQAHSTPLLFVLVSHTHTHKHRHCSWAEKLAAGIRRKKVRETGRQREDWRKRERDRDRHQRELQRERERDRRGERET